MAFLRSQGPIISKSVKCVKCLKVVHKSYEIGCWRGRHHTCMCWIKKGKSVGVEDNVCEKMGEFPFQTSFQSNSILGIFYNISVSCFFVAVFNYFFFLRNKFVW